MFGNLSDRLVETFKNLRSKGKLSAADIDATLREIRRALLEADVALEVELLFQGVAATGINRLLGARQALGRRGAVGTVEGCRLVVDLIRIFHLVARIGDHHQAVRDPVLLVVERDRDRPAGRHHDGGVAIVEAVEVPVAVGVDAEMQ